MRHTVNNTARHMISGPGIPYSWWTANQKRFSKKLVRRYRRRINKKLCDDI